MCVESMFKAHTAASQVFWSVMSSTLPCTPLFGRGCEQQPSTLMCSSHGCHRLNKAAVGNLLTSAGTQDAVPPAQPAVPPAPTLPPPHHSNNTNPPAQMVRCSLSICGGLGFGTSGSSSSGSVYSIVT